MKFEGFRRYPDFPGVEWVVYSYTGFTPTQEDFATQSGQGKQLVYHGTNPHGVAAVLHMGKLINSTNLGLGHRFIQGMEGTYVAPYFSLAASTYAYPTKEVFGDQVYHRFVWEYLIDKDKMRAVPGRPGEKA